MKKKSLMVGINYVGTPNQLRGCVNDILLMNDILTNHYGFTDEKEKRMLLDKDATTANIFDGLWWLVDDVEPGDVLFFSFSGHGSQIPDRDFDFGEEPDGLDECICPVDLDWRSKIVTDDDFKMIFGRIPQGVNLTVLLDCCHSGTGIRNAFENPYLKYNGSRYIPTPLELYEEAVEKKIDGKLKTATRQIRAVVNDEKLSGALISGCKSDQTSADALINRKWHGACTYYLAETLQSVNYDITYTDLIVQLNQHMVANRYTQSPELDCREEFNKMKFLQSFS